MSSKVCFRCSQTKPLEAFYRHKEMRDGHLNKCIECAKADVRANRSAKHDHYRDFDRQRASLPHRRAKSREIIARWRADHPDRRAAQVELGNAVRAGRVIPWPTCAIPYCSAKPEAHHPDYTAPLSVVWLCPAHHKQAHALASAAHQF